MPAVAWLFGAAGLGSAATFALSNAAKSVLWLLVLLAVVFIVLSMVGVV